MSLLSARITASVDSSSTGSVSLSSPACASRVSAERLSACAIDLNAHEGACETALDLTQVRIGHFGQGRQLAQRQVGKLSLRPDELAQHRARITVCASHAFGLFVRHYLSCLLCPIARIKLIS